MQSLTYDYLARRRQMVPDIRKLITVQEAHKQYAVVPATVYHRIHNGRLKGYELNNKWYVDPLDLIGWENTLHKSRHGDVFNQLPGLHEQGITDSELANHLQVSRQRVHQIRNKLGLKANPRKQGLSNMVTRPVLNYKTFLTLAKQQGFDIKSNHMKELYPEVMIMFQRMRNLDTVATSRMNGFKT